MKKKCMILCGLSYFLAVAAAVFRALALTTAYNFETGYFRSGPIPILMHLFLGLSCLGLAVGAFLCRKSYWGSTLFFAAEDCRFYTVFSSALFGFVFFLAFLSYFRSVLSGNLSPLTLIQMILCIPASAAFFIRAISRKVVPPKKEKDFRALLVLCAAFWFMLTIIGLYFDRGLPTNSPTKSLAYLTMIAVMLTLVWEGHFLHGIMFSEASTFFILSMISTVLCAAYAIPNLICIWLAGGPLLSSALYDIMVLSAGIYSGTYSFFLSASLSKEE